MVLGAGKEWQMVAAMVAYRVEDDEREPNRGSEDVRLHQLYADHWRHHVADDVLDRMAVHCGPGEWGRPFVVLLVHQPVQWLNVQEAMHIVEPDLGKKHTHQQIAHNHVHRRQGADVRHAALDCCVVADKRQRYTDDRLIEEDGPHDTQQIRPGDRLILARLRLVAAKEHWPVGQIHQHKQPADDPEKRVHIHGQSPRVEKIGIVT